MIIDRAKLECRPLLGMFGDKYIIYENGDLYLPSTESYPERFKVKQFNEDGYYQYQFNYKGRLVKRLTHRLVAIAFIPNPLNKPQINHIDGNKINNHYSNLEWCTQEENLIHKIQNNLCYQVPINKIDSNGNVIETYKSITKAAIANNIKVTRANYIINNNISTDGFYYVRVR